jgi:hypothetical protein
VVGNSIRESVGGKNIRNQVGERNASSADAEMRARAYTLFINAYEECRAAVGFIRRKHGDAESIAPTVFHRVRRRGAKVEEAETVPDTVGSGAPAPAAPEAATD